MRFWLFVIGAVAVMLSVLGVAQTYHADVPAWLKNPWGLFFLTAVSVLALAVTSRKYIWYYRLLWAVFVFLGWVFFGVRAYEVHDRTYAKLIDAPVQVTATVRIDELSDSIYNPALGESYRQKATLTDIRPVVAVAGASLPNPFYDPKKDSALLELAQVDKPLPSSLEVLLTAYPHKPTQRQPDDPLAALKELSVGSEARMTLLLTPPERSAVRTPSAFDEYRWLLTRHIHAKAQVLNVENVTTMSVQGLSKLPLGVQKLRERYRETFYEKWQSADIQTGQALAVTLSLLTGDRALIDGQTKALYQYGGISHLLAISGAHVLFLAVLLTSLVVRVVNRFAPLVYCFLARWQLRFLVMTAAALMYAYFTGFDVPAVRTVYMLAVVGLARWLLVPWSGLRSLSLTALVLAYLDPYVLWQAGFWLSFVAVAVLLFYENTDKSQTQNFWQSLKVNLRHGAMLQFYVFLSMLPISLLLFGQVSWLGLVVNLFAVGLFGWVVVPMNLLAGVLYGISPALAWWIWQKVAAVLFWLSAALGDLRLVLGEHWLFLPMSVAGIILLFLPILLLKGRLLPRYWAVLPVCAFWLVVVFPSKNIVHDADALQLTKLHSHDKQNLWLLFSKGDRHWLFLDRRSKKETGDEGYATELAQQLVHHGVTYVAGVLILGDDETLAKTAGRLSLAMPVGRLVWSGAAGQRYGRLTAARCGADQSVTQTEAVILTGYGEIDDVAMHRCSVGIWADVPLVLSGFAADTPDEGVIAQPKDSKAVLTLPRTAVVIDGAQDNRLWQVYALLCQSKGLPAQADLWLMHHQGKTRAEDRAVFGSPAVMFASQGDK
ncbi:MAG: ComEC/Rec2 family competence protein [Moraxella sp.]|nr:ComEC/Rec2 family competence protein [Moraxella sp.]